LDYQNNFVGILKIMINAAKSFNILTINLSVLYNYFNDVIILSSTKLFSDLYPTKILDFSAKPFFPCAQLNFAF